MKKIVSILLIALAFMTTNCAMAQDNKQEREKNRKEKWEKFRQDKYNFFVETMELSDEQATQFIALYNELEKKRYEMGRDVRREAHQIMKDENVADEKYQAAADRAAALPKKIVALEEEYYQKFRQILTPRQQFLYHRCETEFQKSLINKKCKGGKKMPKGAEK